MGKASGKSEEELATWLVERIAAALKVAPAKIDRKASFARYGLDSVRAVELVGDLEDFLDQRLDPTVVWEHPSVEKLARHFAQGTSAPVAADTGARTSSGKASGMQQAINMLQQQFPGTYLIGRAVRLQGAVNAAALQSAINDVVARHGMLKTSLRDDRGTMVWEEHPRAELRLELENGASWSEETLDARMVEITTRPFDTGAAPLARAHLIQRGATEHILVVAVDHRVFDAWSLFLLFFDLAEAFAAREQGKSANLAPAERGYDEFIRAEVEALERKGPALQKFWRSQVQGQPQFTPVPTNRPARANDDLWVVPRFLKLDRAKSDRLRAFAAANDCTSYQFILAAWALAIRSQGGAERFPVTSSIHVRRPEQRGAVGPFLNQIPFMVDASGDPTVTEYVAKIRASVARSREHEDFPFGQMLGSGWVDWKDRVHLPLLQVQCNYYNFSGLADRSSSKEAALLAAKPNSPFNLGTLRAEPLTISRRKAPFDLSLWVTVDNEELVCRLEACAARFDVARIDQLLQLLDRMAEAMIANPQQRISEVQSALRA